MIPPLLAYFATSPRRVARFVRALSFVMRTATRVAILRFLPAIPCAWQHCFLLFLLVSLVSCGGGGSSTTGGGGNVPPGNPPDFSLLVGVPSVTLQQQGAYQIQGISAKTVNGFSGDITLSISGLPAGVTTIPGSVPILSPTGSVSSSGFQMVAAQNAAVGTTTITVTGTSGALTHSVTFPLSVTAAAPFTIQLSPSNLLMTPATTGHVTVTVTPNPGTTLPPLSVSLSPPNSIPTGGVKINLIQGSLTPSAPASFSVQADLVAQPTQNFPIVVTASDNLVNSNVAVLPLTISVPFSSNTAPTRTNFVSTDQPPTGVVYDPARKLLFVSIEVLNQVAVFSSVDGHRVATIPVLFPAGIDESADGSAIYVVSPFSTSITTIDPNLLQVVQQTLLPQGLSGLQVATLANGEVMVLIALNGGAFPPAYIWNPTAHTFTGFAQRIAISSAGITRSFDHSKVLFFGPSASGASAVLYDSATRTILGPATVSSSNLAISPDGSQIAAIGDPTFFYDSRFRVVGSTPMTGLFPIKSALYSLDGLHLYVLGTYSSPTDMAAAIDIATFSLAGVVPGFQFGTFLPFSGQVVTPYAIDQNNIIFAGTSFGMAYLDGNTPGFIALPISTGSRMQPTLLSLASPTQVQLSGASLSSAWNYNVYFGAPPASPLSQVGTNVSVQSSNVLALTAPAGTVAGPANVTLSRSDGYFQVLPNAVSYGPSVLRVDPDTGSSVGGDSVVITGYGFGSSSAQVTIGGKPANITQVRGSNGGLNPIETIFLTTPSGAPGNSDVSVITPMGSTTVSGGFQYLVASQIFPIPGALDNIIYDQLRQKLYITNEDHNRIEIFDLLSRTYLAPVVVGNQPTGLALTPDNSLLAVVNSADGTVSVLDASSMQIIHTWSALAPGETSPAAVALTIAPVTPHRALVNVFYPGVIDGGAIHLLNLDTGSLSCAGAPWCINGNIVGGPPLAAMASVADGTKVFLADMTGGGMGLLDFTANTLTRGFTGRRTDAAADADGNIFAANLALTNTSLSRTAIAAYEPYTAGDVRFQTVFGEKLNGSGSLLFIPQINGVDIFDVHTGRLVQHVILPEGIPADLGGLALDETGTKMFLISNSGITIAQLSQLPLSVASVTPASGLPGITVSVRGSGFQSGASVSFDGMQASTTTIDPNTLRAVVPAKPSGPTRVTVVNPDGHAYSFDAAFSVQ